MCCRLPPRSKSEGGTAAGRPRPSKPPQKHLSEPSHKVHHSGLVVWQLCKIDGQWKILLSGRSIVKADSQPRSREQGELMPGAPSARGKGNCVPQICRLFRPSSELVFGPSRKFSQEIDRSLPGWNSRCRNAPTERLEKRQQANSDPQAPILTSEISCRPTQSDHEVALHHSSSVAFCRFDGLG